MEAVTEKKGAGRNRQVTDRDRELCGFLAVCRYLTREQIERLMFPGRSKARSSTRLRQLAEKLDGQGALLRGDLGFGSAEGWTAIWALTAEGFELGAQHLSLKLERVPKHDVGQQFLKHEVFLNEVFLGLVAQDGKTPAKVPRNFRWTLGEYLDLPFKEFDVRHGVNEKRRLQPDAVIEDPATRRRFFIEYETGSATVRDVKKSTSTMAKLDRYATFLTGYARSVINGDKSTFYSRAFPDEWPAEVLFVAQSEARRETIDEVMREREEQAQRKFPFRAFTLDEAQLYLRLAIYRAPRVPDLPRRNNAQKARAVAPSPVMLRPAAPAEMQRVPPAPAAPPVLPIGPARSAEEERLRRGRVAVRGEQLIEFEKTMKNMLNALVCAREALARMKLPADALPPVPATAHATLHTMSLYARRGSEALAKYAIAGSD
jgi:hypothetical protein